MVRPDECLRDWRDENMAIQDHNKPLFDQMIKKGFKLKRNERTTHFVDSAGEFVPYPKGYITGPSYNDNGTHVPWYTSVCLGGSWAQFSSANRQEVIDKALEKAKEVLGTP